MQLPSTLFADYVRPVESNILSTLYTYVENLALKMINSSPKTSALRFCGVTGFCLVLAPGHIGHRPPCSGARAHSGKAVECRVSRKGLWLWGWVFCFLGVVVCIVFVLDVCGCVVGLVGVWMLRV